MRRLSTFAYFKTVPKCARPLSITCFGVPQFMNESVASVLTYVSSAERIVNRWLETIGW